MSGPEIPKFKFLMSLRKLPFKTSFVYNLKKKLVWLTHSVCGDYSTLKREQYVFYFANVRNPSARGRNHMYKIRPFSVHIYFVS